jgi:chromosome segregation ATPase
MSDQSKAAAHLPLIDRDDLQRAQDEIQMAHEELDATLEQMKEALDAGDGIDSDLFQEAEEHLKELEVQANSLRNDLEKLKAQQSPNP